MRLELVTRSGCHLCAEAEAALAEVGLPFEKRDVDADAELSRLYDFRVPVLLADGAVRAEGRISAEAVRRALER
jgi:glutaredoxin